MSENIFSNKNNMSRIAALVDEFSSSSLILEHKKLPLYNLRTSGAKVSFINGVQGSGKSTLIDLYLKIEVNKKAIVFDCYENVCLDDIIFFFYRVLYENKLLDRKNLRKDETYAKESIDQKIISSINNLNENITIVFDSFEKLFQNKDGKIDSDILNFIEYLIKNRNTSVIISSRIAPDDLYSKYQSISEEINIPSLTEDDVVDLIQSRNIDATKSTIEKFYEITMGIPLYVKSFLMMMIDMKNDDLFDAMVQMTKSGKSFENYVFTNRYDALEDKETFNKLCLIRHPSDKEFLYEIISKSDLTYLLNKNMITAFRGSFYIKDYFKDVVLPLLSQNMLSKYHEELSGIYEKQIPLKHSQRLIKLSRTSLSEECSYHKQMSKSSAPKISSSDIDFIASTLNDDAILLMDKEISQNKGANNSLLEEEEEKLDKQQPPIPSKKSLSSASQNDDNLDFLNNAVDGQTLLDGLGDSSDVDMEGISINLSEEEKMLLSSPSGDDEIDTSAFMNRKSIDLSDLENFRNRSTYEDVDLSDVSAKDELLSRALKCESEGDYQRALEYFKKYHYEIRGGEKEVYALDKISICFTHLGNKEEAVNALEKAYLICFEKSEFSKAGQILLSMAKVFKEFKDYARAKKTYEKFFSQELSWIEPKYIAEAYKDLGDIFNQENNFRQAISNYTKAMEMLSRYDEESESEADYASLLAELYFKIGLLYDDAGDISKAVTHYRNSEKTDNNPDSNLYLADCYSNLGLIFREKGDFKTALDYLSKTFEIDRSKSNLEGIYYSSLKLADIYCDLKEYKNALKFYTVKLDAAKKINSVYYISSTYLDLGDMYSDMADFSKAVKFFILAQKVLGDAISTDSQYRIQRRINNIKRKVGLHSFENILKDIKNA